jgi:voltage-gated sodium channel
MSNLQSRLKRLIENSCVQKFIIILIVINAILLGFETYPALMESAGTTIIFLDHSILLVFVIEIAIRIFVYRLSFWRDPWSLFDFSVVMIALVPAAGPLSVLRALRVLRVLRLMTMMPAMRRVIGALVSAVPGLGSIGLMLLIFYYVCAVIATNFFSADFPQWFGTLSESFYTLFQIMTLESWSMGIVRPVMETHPYAWAFFIPFILIATFTMLNLFIAVIVNAIQNYQAAENERIVEEILKVDVDIESEMHEQFQKLSHQIADIKRLLQQK